MSLDSSLNASDLSLEITSEPSNESADWMGSSVENSEEIRESADSFRKTSFFTHLDHFLLETHVRDWTRTAEIRAVSLIGYLLRAKFENRKRFYIAMSSVCNVSGPISYVSPTIISRSLNRS